MRLGNRLVLAAGVIWLAAAAVSAAMSPLPADTSSEPSPPPVQTAAPAPSVAGPVGSPAAFPGQERSGEDYLGSDACARCHQGAHEQWQRSLHIKMTKPIAEATVLGDFRPNTRFEDHGRSYEFGMRAGRPFVRVSHDAAPAETFDVQYTLGAKRYQGYLSTLPDGRIYVLPAFWHVDTQRWVDWKEITPIPDGAHDLRQIWNSNCFNCHATNLVQGFDLPAKVYKTTWTEMGIGCEACHGPGRPHVTLMDEWQQTPASKPVYDTSARNRELGTILRIFSPRTAAPRQVFDSCAYCHGNKSNTFVGFRAGDRYEDFSLPFFISAPIPATDLQGEFWPDGRPNRFNRPQALTLSGCFQAGAIACTNCHVAHGSRNDFSLKVNINQGRTGDVLCTQCHTGPAAPSPQSSEALRLVGSRSPSAPSSNLPWSDAELERHTFHQAASSGSRCISCHMSDVNWRLLIRRRDHTFRPPVPELTAAAGVPNACTTCHDERTPEWAATQMNGWWGDGRRRAAAVSLADTMYRAGAGDRSVMPALAGLAVDRTQGMLVRASAVDFMRQLLSGGPGAVTVQSQTSFGKGPAAAAVPEIPAAPLPPALVNALIGAAADPEPMVRSAAVRALGAVGRQNAIVAAVLARLVDQARIVRTDAAAVLLAFGIAQLPGRAGAVLTRAQDELVSSLEMFPDSAQHHTQRAWLEGERGHLQQANAALDAAIHLEPAYARPIVIKGVLAAREDRYEEAVALWKKARSLEPSYPNIDKLIAEAERRKAP